MIVALSRADRLLSPASSATIATFSSTDRAERRLKSWKMKPNWWRRMSGSRSLGQLRDHGTGEDG